MWLNKRKIETVSKAYRVFLEKGKKDKIVSLAPMVYQK